MFIKDEASYEFFDTGRRIPDVPTSIKVPELTASPSSKVGPKSGAYLMADYCRQIKLCQSNAAAFNDIFIEENFYNPLEKTYGYVKFNDALKKVAVLCGCIEADVTYFNTIPFIKHFIHKFQAIVVELLPDNAICSTHINNINGVYECPVLSGSLFDSRITKGFIACSYDEDGILLQNSLGPKAGSLSFMHMAWDKLQMLLVKAGCIKNIHYFGA